MERNYYINRLSELQTYIIAFSLFFSVIVYIPFFTNAYLIPKLTIIYWGSFISLCIEGVKILISKQRQYLIKSDFFIICLFIIHALAFIASDHKGYSFWGEYTQEGLDFFSIISYLSVVWTYKRLNTHQQTIIKYFFIAATTLASSYAIYKYFSLGSRPSGLDGQPILSSATISMGLLILADIYHTTVRQLQKKSVEIYLYSLSIIFHCFGLFFLDSSSVVFTLICAFLVSFTVCYIFGRVSGLKKIIVTIILTCGLFLLLWSVFLPKETFGLHRRVLQYKTLMKMLILESTQSPQKLRNILIGHGQNTSGLYYRIYKDPQLNNDKEWQWQLSKIRHHYLEIFFTTGLIGTLIWMSILGAAVYRSYKQKMFIGVTSLSFLALWQLVYYIQPIVFIIGLLFVADAFSGTTTAQMRTHRGTFVKIIAIYFILLGVVGFFLAFRLAIAEYYFSSKQYMQAFISAPHNSKYRALRAAELYSQIVFYRSKHRCILQRTCCAHFLYPRYNEAIYQIREAVAINPYEAESWSLLGILTFFYYFDQDQKDYSLFEESLKASHVALQYDPQNPIYLDNVGAGYLEKSEYAIAEQYFKRSVEVKPDYWGGYSHLDEVYKQTGNSQGRKWIENNINKLKHQYSLDD